MSEAFLYSAIPWLSSASDRSTFRHLGYSEGMRNKYINEPVNYEKLKLLLGRERSVSFSDDVIAKMEIRYFFIFFEGVVGEEISNKNRVVQRSIV